MLFYPCRGPKALLGTDDTETKVGSVCLPLKANLFLSSGLQSSACTSDWSDAAGLGPSAGRDVVSFFLERADSSFLSNAGLLE